MNKVPTPSPRLTLFPVVCCLPPFPPSSTIDSMKLQNSSDHSFSQLFVTLTRIPNKNNLDKERFYFGLLFQRSQSMVG